MNIRKWVVKFVFWSSQQATRVHFRKYYHSGSPADTAAFKTSASLNKTPLADGHWTNLLGDSSLIFLWHAYPKLRTHTHAPTAVNQQMTQPSSVKSKNELLNDSSHTDCWLLEWSASVPHFPRASVRLSVLGNLATQLQFTNSRRLDHSKLETTWRSPWLEQSPSIHHIPYYGVEETTAEIQKWLENIHTLGKLNESLLNIHLNIGRISSREHPPLQTQTLVRLS